MTEYAQARQFLASVVPWPEDGEDGYVDIVSSFKKEGDDTLRWGGRAVRDLGSAINAIGWLKKQPGTVAIYFCTSLQREAREKIAKNGRSWFTPIRNQENALKLKTLWLDMGESEADGGYKTPSDAAKALNKFIADSNLPRPNTIVASGGGLHVYWVLARALTPAEWLPLARALVNATEKHGLKHDHKIAADCSRILRIPDTMNLKYDPPRPVRLSAMNEWFYNPETIEEALEPYKVAPLVNGYHKPTETFVIEGTRPSKLNGGPVTNDLAAGIERREFPPMSEAELRACVDAIPNPASTDWSTWNTMGMRLFAASDGADFGLKLWEAWSAKHPNYGTNEKDSCEARWETYKTSPPTHTGAGALVNAARTALGDPQWRPPSPVVTPTVTLGLPPLPVGYARDHRGFLCRQIIKGADGTIENEVILEHPILDGMIQAGPPGILWFDTLCGQLGRRRIELPTEHINGLAMRSWLQKQLVMVPGRKKALEHIGDFMKSWSMQLLESQQALTSTAFGWVIENGTPAGFAFAGKKFLAAGGHVSAGHPDPETARRYAPTGQIAPWQRASRLITDQKRADLNVILASAFAAPLFAFSGQKGVVANAFSESGKGKTTAMEIAQAVWGNPVTAMSSLTATYKSTMKKMGDLQSLPIYLDEVRTQQQMKDLATMVFNVTAGKDGDRLTRDVQQRGVGHWQTIMMCATNQGLLDWIVNHEQADAATIYRIFQFFVKPPKATGPGRMSQTDAASIQTDTYHNYGLVGEIYAEWLAKNHVTIKQEMIANGKRLEKLFQCIPEERNWLSFINATVVGAKYANTLKFTDFDLPAMETFLYECLTKLRLARVEEVIDLTNLDDVKQVMSRFMADHAQRHTLYTDVMWRGVGRPQPRSVKVVLDSSRLTTIHVQRASDGWVRISTARLNEWLIEQGAPRKKIVDAMRNTLPMTNLRGTLGAGTDDPRIEGGQQHLWELQASSYEA